MNRLKALFAFAVVAIGLAGCGDNKNQYGAYSPYGNNGYNNGYNNGQYGWYNGQGTYCGNNPNQAGCGQYPYYYSQNYGWTGPYYYNTWSYYPSYGGNYTNYTGWGCQGQNNNFYGWNSNAWFYGYVSF